MILKLSIKKRYGLFRISVFFFELDVKECLIGLRISYICHLVVPLFRIKNGYFVLDF